MKAPYSHRRGYAVLQTMAAMALLTAATIGLVRIAKVHSLLRQADQKKLSARLVAGNIIERLRVGKDLEIADLIVQAEADAPSMRVQVNQFAVDTDAATGTHFVVDVFDRNPIQATDQTLAKEHFWILTAADGRAKEGESE
jgi:hypothetical protein